ncbi:MAG: MinD/ParA family protein [Pseudonocardia sp.]|nr:MinD/ParA family protein [Pseudonocardia sp.]
MTAEPSGPDETLRADESAEPARGQPPVRPTTIPPATSPPLAAPPTAMPQQAAPLPSGAELADPAPRAPGLSHETLARRRSERPTMGWRAALYALTGLNPGPSEVESRRNAKIARIKAPLPGCFKLAVVSLKGGVGKTTTTGLLGLTLAEHRGDRAIALDANPDAGTLAERLLGYEPQVTVRDLLANIDRIETLTHVDPSRALSGYTALAGRLHVLASEQDPAMSEMFNSEEYAAVSRLLSRFYNIILTDSGTGLVHSAMQGTLDNTHSLVIVGAPTVDGASRAAKTLDYLAAHGFEQMVRNAVVALSCDRHSDDIKRDVIVDHFAERVRAVVEIPADRHLAMGGMIDLRYLAEPTRDAALDLAAAVTDAFNGQHHVTQSTEPRARAGQR